MEIFVKENGTKDPLLPVFLDQHKQSKQAKTAKSKRFRRCRSAPAAGENLMRSQQNCLSSELPFTGYNRAHNIRPALSQAALILVIYLGVGIICLFSIRNELKGVKTNAFVDTLYFCIVTMTTVGYGDLVPAGIPAKLFACAFVFAGMSIVALLLSDAAGYLVEKQEMLLIKAFHERQFPDDDFCKENTTIKARWKLLVTVAILLALIVIGIAVLHEVEGLDLLNSFYCVCATITTLGYGDQSFSTEGGRIFAVIWILVSTLCLTRFFLYVAELKTEERQHSLVHWAVTRRVTISDFEAADMDSDGVVSAAEFILYKLKEMGKIEAEDIDLVMREFKDLDVDQNGTLTVSDLHLAQPVLEN